VSWRPRNGYLDGYFIPVTIRCQDSRRYSPRRGRPQVDGLGDPLGGGCALPKGRLDGVRPRQVGDGARQLQHLVIRPRAELHPRALAPWTVRPGGKCAASPHRGAAGPPRPPRRSRAPAPQVRACRRWWSSVGTGCSEPLAKSPHRKKPEGMRHNGPGFPELGRDDFLDDFRQCRECLLTTIPQVWYNLQCKLLPVIEPDHAKWG
jgi:hypothetical protein